MLGFIRGQSRALGTVLGTDMPRQDKGSEGLDRRCRCASSSVSPAQPETDKKVHFSKLPGEPFVPLLSKFMRGNHPNPWDLLMAQSAYTS